jgi:hypothetical protein
MSREYLVLVIGIRIRWEQTSSGIEARCQWGSHYRIAHALSIARTAGRSAPKMRWFHGRWCARAGEMTTPPHATEICFLAGRSACHFSCSPARPRREVSRADPCLRLQDWHRIRLSAPGPGGSEDSLNQDRPARSPACAFSERRSGLTDAGSLTAGMSTGDLPPQWPPCAPPPINAGRQFRDRGKPLSRVRISSFGFCHI